MQQKSMQSNPHALTDLRTTAERKQFSSGESFQKVQAAAEVVQVDVAEKPELADFENISTPPDGLQSPSSLMPAPGRNMLRVVAPSCQRKAKKSMARRKGQRGSVERKGNKYWGKYYADEPGLDYRPQKRVCIGSVDAMTETEAKRRLLKILEALGVNTREHLERSFEPVVTLTQRANKWIGDVKAQYAKDGEYARVKRSSFPSIESIINRHLKPRFGHMAVDDIGQNEVDDLIEDLAA